MVRQLLSGKTAFLSIFSPCSFQSLKICGFEGFRGLHIIEQKNYLKSKREFCWFMKASPTQGREGVCFMDDLVPGNPTVLRVSSLDVSCFHSYQHFGQLSPPHQTDFSPCTGEYSYWQPVPCPDDSQKRKQSNFLATDGQNNFGEN